MIDLPLLAELGLALLIVATLERPAPAPEKADPAGGAITPSSGLKDRPIPWKAESDRHAQRILRIERLHVQA